eukprot:jgi/Pico_ML_1/52733/g3398.t1
MVEVQVNDQTRVGELLDSVVERTGCDPSTVKLVQGNVVLTQVEREKRIDDCGVKAKKKFMAVASAAGDVLRVREAKTERLRSFEEEADIVRRRAQVGPSQTDAATTCDRFTLLSPDTAARIASAMENEEGATDCLPE